MELIGKICDFIEESQSNSKNVDSHNPDSKKNSTKGDERVLLENNSSPRDGMSSQTAAFQIGCCPNSKGYQIERLENKGRYFTARVCDKKGKLVNELLVDKLTGKVKFIR